MEALENRYALTLFQSAGQSSDSITIGETTTSFSGSSAENTSLENQLSNTFDSAFEFNYPEDTFWTQEKANDEGGSVASDLRKNAIRRLMSFIYRSVKESNVNMSNPEYGDQNGWSATDKAKWQSAYFRAHVAEYFDVDYLCTYYLFTDYWASVDQRAKNILWRTWDGLKWYPTYYDGDTAQSIRNDAFMVYLYSVTRDTYDTERSKYAFEGHDSWLWCLLLANVEYGNAQTNPIYDRLATCARAFRNQVSLDAMLTEFNTNMMWNWSERQYNYSQKLKYIDTMDVKYYPYTLTGNREAHRTQFLTERSALLDAQYTAGDYLTDTFVIFANREANEDPNTIVIKSGDLYYFGFRDVQNNWVVRPQRTSAGELVTLTISQALAGTSGSSNVTGASKIRELDLTGMRSNITGSGVNLSSCVILEKLVFTATGNYRFGGTLQLGQTSKLQHIELTGQTGINDGQTGRLNLSYHTRLGTVLLSGTGLETLILPEGAPITTLSLPKTLGVLTLRNLPLLTMANLTMEDNVWTGFLGFNFSNCPNLSWTELLNRCTNAKRVRIEGLGGRIHSSQIIKFMEGWNPNNPTDSSNLVYHGLNANGTNNNWPQFGGSVVKLIDLVDTVTVGGVVYTAEQMKSFFEKCELTLLDPQYSVYEIDDTLTVDDGNGNLVLTSACVKNLENNSMASDVTGTGYVASGHAVRVRDKMKPVWGKLVTEGENVGKWVGVEMSGSGYGKYKNGSDISNYKTDEEGNDAMMLLPHCWYKGVNDFVHQKKYIIWSSVENGTNLNGESIPPQSSATNTTRKKLSELVKQTGAYVNWSGIEEGSTTIEEAIVIDNNVDLDVYRIDVEGMKQVRWPGAIKHSTYGACFMNADGIVVKRFRLNVQDADFDYQRSEGDYIFTDVPPDAKTFVFSCDSAANANWEVIAVDSDEIEAIEPDWVEHKECLVGIYQASLHRVAFSSGSNPNQLLPKGLRSISGATVTRGSVSSDSSTHSGWESENLYDATTGNPTGWPTTNSFKMSMKDFQNIARLRGAGYQLVDYEMSKFVSILFYCLTGTLNSQEVCGDGRYITTTGTWDSIGNRSTSALEFANYTSRANKCLGLESWFGCVYEWCDNVGVNITSYINFYKNHMVATGSSNGRWWIFDPETGTERYVKGQTENTSSSGGYIKRVRHGRYCDLVPIIVHGTSTSRYADWYYYTTSTNRVLGRSNNNGSAYGGVAYAYAYVASSYANPYYGSRLAFRGDIVLQEP